MRRRVAILAFVGLTGLFVLLHLSRNWGAIRAYRWEFNHLYLAGAFAFDMVGSLIAAYIWCAILRDMRCDMGFRKALKVISLSLPAKYLPGIGWNYLVQVHMCERKDIRGASAAASIALERGIWIVAGVCAFLLCLCLSGGTRPAATYYPVLFALPIALVVIHPQIFARLANCALHIFHRRPIDVSVRYRRIICLTAFYIGAWGLAGVGFWLFVQSLFPATMALLAGIGILALSVIVSFLTPFMPGGLVVREAMLVSLLQAYMPVDAAIMIAVAYRFLNSVRELVFAAIALKL